MDKITFAQKESARQQAAYCIERADRDAARAVIAEYHAQNETPAMKARRARMALLQAGGPAAWRP